MTTTYTTLSKKIVGLFILLGILSCGGEQFSSSPTITNNTNQQQDDTAQQTVSVPTWLPGQVAHVKSSLGFMLDGQECRLILGVNNGEVNLLERFKDSDILLDKEHQNPFDPRSLTVDFNDLTQLQYLATQLAGAFDTMALDDSTFHFTKWTKDHLVQFRNLLKPNGKFIFAPQFAMFGVGAPQDLTKPEKVIQTIIDQMQLETSEILITGGFPIPQNFYRLPPDMLQGFLNSLLRYAFVPKNYVRILEQAFGQGNLQVENDSNLPFPTRNIDHEIIEEWIQPVVITATRN